MACLRVRARITMLDSVFLCSDMDMDGDGYINVDDLNKKFGQQLKREYIEQLMKDADSDGDGQITFVFFSILAFVVRDSCSV